MLHVSETVSQLHYTKMVYDFYQVLVNYA